MTNILECPKQQQKSYVRKAKDDLNNEHKYSCHCLKKSL